MHPQMVVTLVHGTFAKGAPWTQLFSDFTCELKGGLHLSTLFTRVDWSGGNDIYARLAGSHILSKHIKELKEQYPEAFQYVIAHSHGGNVALYATRDVEIDGIACLATPFFHARERDGSLLTDKSFQRGLIGVFCFISFLSGLSAGVSIYWWIAILFGTSLVCSLIAAVLSALSSFVASRSREMAAVITADVPAGMRLCSIRITGDEASSSLAAGQILAWASVRLSSHFAKAKDLQFFKNPWRGLPIPKSFWILPAFAVIFGGCGQTFESPQLLRIGGFLVSLSILVLRRSQDQTVRQSSIWSVLSLSLDYFGSRRPHHWHDAAAGS
ncbi:hypothetical protein [Bradyrhizobium sp. LM2.9]